MIPVAPQPEPEDFDQRVRQPGLRWLESNDPQEKELPPYWRSCLDDLHRAYGGICAYVCVYIEPVTGARTTDHFVARSPRPELAYEWSNYRLACSVMNSRKREFDDVLDPFTLAADTFRLVLLTGEIQPAAQQNSAQWRLADATIQRLGLDEPACRDLRTRYYLEYREGHISGDYLRRRAPFVWQEARRQGRL